MNTTITKTVQTIQNLTKISTWDMLNTFMSTSGFLLWFGIIAIVIMAILLECEREGWTTTIFSLGVALLLWTNRENFFGFISKNPGNTIGFILSYVVAGIIWSSIKWRTYIKKKSAKYNELKDSFIKIYKDKGGIADNWGKWVEHLSDGIPYCNRKSLFKYQSPTEIVQSIIPAANDKRSLILSWILYWPISLGVTLLNNLFRRFFEWIYSLVSNIYDKIGSKETAAMLVGLEKNENDSDKSGKKILKG